ncbi:MAG: hypothetical protein ACTSSH_13760 [Candidatus Heimdallarchaeota archaeon]
MKELDYEYCNYLQPPEKNSLQIPYNLLVNLVSVAPKTKRNEFLETRLQEYGYLRDGNSLKDVEDRIRFAENWVKDYSQLEEIKVELDATQKKAITAFVKALETAKTADDVQTAIFESARDNNIKPRDFFKILYQILLNTDRGPKLGPYIHTIGIKSIIKTLKKNL